MSDVKVEYISKATTIHATSAAGFEHNYIPVVRLEQHQAALAAKDAVLQELAFQLAAKEQELAQMKATLQDHWVTAVECNHEDKTDTVRCSCSVWTGTPQPSIGKAIEQWVQHVMEQR